MSDSLATAWKLYNAQVDWTTRVDTKASFAFSIESAVLGLAVAVSASGSTSANLHGLSVVLYLLGITSLLGGILCALLTVIPRLRARQAGQEVGENFVYFGDLRLWKASDLVKVLEADNLVLGVLLRQSITVAE